MRIGAMVGGFLVLIGADATFGFPSHQGRGDVRLGAPRTLARAVRKSLSRAHDAERSRSEQTREGEVREIPVDTLKDVAVALYRPEGSVIYYNPTLTERLGPELTTFFMAHEYGHISMKHSRANALLAGESAHDSVLQQRELQADCYASAHLAPVNRAAVDAAARFFSRMGQFRFDAAHPSGAQRAAKILSCVPANEATSVPDSLTLAVAAQDSVAPDSALRVPTLPALIPPP